MSKLSIRKLMECLQKTEMVAGAGAGEEDGGIRFWQGESLLIIAQTVRSAQLTIKRRALLAMNRL